VAGQNIVTKRSRQIIACYVALCVAFAGAIGFSPTLHVWVEHGGHGAAHTHSAASVHAAIHHEHPHPHRSEEAPTPPPARTLRISTAPPLTLFGLEVQDLFRGVNTLLAWACPVESSDPTHSESEHSHHSLAQMLAQGAVEALAVSPPVAIAPHDFNFSPLTTEAHLATADWYAPTASRGPPRCC
jgi:hypothetical protein